MAEARPVTRDSAVCPLCGGAGELRITPGWWQGGLHRLRAGRTAHGIRVCHHCLGTGSVCDRLDAAPYAAGDVRYDNKLVLGIDCVKELDDGKSNCAQ